MDGGPPGPSASLIHPLAGSDQDQPKLETAPLPAPFLVHHAWTGPLRLALAGATHSGTAGGEACIAVRK